MAQRLIDFGTAGTVFSGGASRPVPAPATPAAGPTSAVLVLDGVWKEGAPALAGLDLQLSEGECVTLLGPAGAGKSAVIDLAAGFLGPDEGAVLIRGERQARRAAWQRDIGLVAGEPDLFPHMDILANTAFPLEARGLDRAAREDRAAAVLERWGVPAALHRSRPEALAPSLRVRAALARAVSHGPSLLLLDDPLRGLAGEEREALAADLFRLRREMGLTVLHATRDAGLAFALSDRVAVLEGGIFRQVGTPEALYDRPADLAVAALTGPCNRLPGEVLTREDDLCRVRLDCGVEVLGVPARDMLAPGARCVLAIRPEHVAVAPLPPEAMGEEALPARLLEQRFAGSHVRLRLSLGEGGEILAHRPPGLPLPEAGAPASIAWNLPAARLHPA